MSILAVGTVTAQGPQQPEWTKLEPEILQHFQSLVRFDTSDPPLNPPGGEKPAADYIKQVLDKAGIPAQILALEPNRPNVVARLKGNGSKRPILLMTPVAALYGRKASEGTVNWITVIAAPT